MSSLVPSLRKGFDWWVGQLGGVVATILPGRAAAAERFAVLDLVSPPGAVPASVTATLPGRPPASLVLTAAGLGQLRALLGPAARVRLRLPSGLLLQRDVTLPIAAEAAPDQVLQYELDRLTPFRTEEVFWSYQILQRDRAHGRLHLRLTLAPREALAPLLDMLRAAGVTPALLEAPAGTAWRRVELGGSAARRQPVRRAALAACAALALAAVVVPFVRQSLALAGVQARIDTLAPATAEAAALHRRMAAANAGGDVMQAARQHIADPLQALAVVTDALPDDTWLTDLTLHQRHLALDGHSAAAVRLIARLSAEPAIRNPAFTAPVTRADGGHGDVFSIGAEVAP